MELIKLIFSLVHTFITTFFTTIITLFQTPAVILLLCIILIVYTFKIMKYRKTVYYEQTKCSYFRLQCDKGRLGEYRTYMNLRKYEREGARFLFNIYIPKEDGQTTEIDVLMITTKGIFVFESKNYSGWIFGSENQKNWYQTLPVGKGRKSSKEQFFNPIIQNRSHIKHLKTFIGEDIPMYSVIVFSNRCTLKGVDIKSDVKVIYRANVSNTVASICSKIEADCLTETAINNIFDKLYPYSQVDVATKEKHIADIENNLNAKKIVVPIENSIEVITDNASETEAVKEEKVEEVVVDERVVEETNTTEACSKNVPVTDEILQKTEQIQQEKLVCPRCGGKLVLRTATRGVNAGSQFYGCSNYPRCRYIKTN